MKGICTNVDTCCTNFGTKQIQITHKNKFIKFVNWGQFLHKFVQFFTHSIKNACRVKYPDRASQCFNTSKSGDRKLYVAQKRCLKDIEALKLSKS